MQQVQSGKKIQALILAAIAAAMLAFGLTFAVQQAYALPPGGPSADYTTPDGTTWKLQNIGGKNAVTIVGVKTTKTAITSPSKVFENPTYKVACVASNAFKGCTAKTVTLANTVKKIKKNAFKGSKVKTLIVKSTQLTKKSVKGSLKGSKVKVVKVPKNKVKKYTKFFAKKNSGKKVKVKAA